MIETIPIWLADPILWATFAFWGAIIATIWLVRTSKGNPDHPKPTGEYYTPKDDADLPGWEK